MENTLEMLVLYFSYIKGGSLYVIAGLNISNHNLALVNSLTLLWLIGELMVEPHKVLRQ